MGAAGTVVGTVGMAVAVARAEVATTVDKATGRADVKREEMTGAEAEEGTTAAGQWRDHLPTLRTLGQIELAPSDIAASPHHHRGHCGPDDDDAASNQGSNCDCPAHVHDRESPLEIAEVIAKVRDAFRVSRTLKNSSTELSRFNF